jgi:hypothetical protein
MVTLTPASHMANAVNHNLGRGRLIKDHVRAGIGDDAAEPCGVRHLSAMGMVCETVNCGLQATLDVLRAARRSFLDIVEDRVHLAKGTTCVADFHRPCFAHVARTSPPVANSPLVAPVGRGFRRFEGGLAVVAFALFLHSA